MNQFPKTIENCIGEKIVFKELVQEPDGDKLILHGWVQPKSGPPMHVHYKQDEGVTVKKDRSVTRYWVGRNNWRAKARA
ncbi:MAG: hypothetical protein ACXVJB_15750 [Mucilaginibacter sp.]